MRNSVAERTIPALASESDAARSEAPGGITTRTCPPGLPQPAADRASSIVAAKRRKPARSARMLERVLEEHRGREGIDVTAPFVRRAPHLANRASRLRGGVP